MALPTGAALAAANPPHYTFTVTWSDGTTTSHTVDLGVFADLPGGLTAAQQLRAAALAYFRAYLQGLQQTQVPATPASITAAVGVSLAVS